MDSLVDFADSISGFYSKTAVDQPLLIGWFQEMHEGKNSFDAASLRSAFLRLGVNPPNVSQYLNRLTQKRPPQLVKVGSGFRLAPTVRRAFDRRIGHNPSTVTVSKILSELPDRIPSMEEREFLIEALRCYRVKAFRAAIVMIWNLAFDHLMEWLVADQTRLGEFNQGIAKRFPKKQLVIASRDDFEELKESEVIAVCRTARILNKNIVDILDAKLKRRNSAAHPSKVVVTQVQADDSITDLVNNVILRLI